MYIKKKWIILILVYLGARSWDILLSYVAYMHSQMLFVVGERNKEIVDFFTSKKATFLVYEVFGFFLFISLIYFAQMLWERKFRIFPLFISSLPLCLSFLAPLTWFWPGPELAFYFNEITWEKAALLIALVALFDFCRWLIKRHFFIFVKVLN